MPELNIKPIFQDPDIAAVISLFSLSIQPLITDHQIISLADFPPLG